MHLVSGGFTPHKIKGDGDYESQKRAAVAQSQKNSYIQGVQSVMDEGAVLRLLIAVASMAMLI